MKRNRGLFRKTLRRWVCQFSIGLVLAAVHPSFSLADPHDRTMIDPNAEKVIVSIRGVNFDIPLGYFFHDAAFARMAWPAPSTVRSVERTLVITAAIEGLQPWTRDTSAAFASGRGTMRIRLNADTPANWLDNYMKYRNDTLYESSLAGNLDGLKGYGSKHGGKNDVFYLPSLPPQKPYLILYCDDFRPDSRMCKVTFDYRDGIVVEYAMPVWKMKHWRKTHQSVIALLNSFLSK